MTRFTKLCRFFECTKLRLRVVIFLAVHQMAFSSDIAVVTLAAGEGYAKSVQSSIENKQAYCLLHGYDFICGDETLDASRPIPWSKIRLILDVLKRGDHQWVFWTDSDSLIMNDSIKLEELIDNHYDFILCSDHNPIDDEDVDILPKWRAALHYLPNLNTGQFLIKKSKWSIDFLEKCYFKEEFVFHPWWEQASILDLLFEDIKEHVYWSKTKTIPYRLMNSFPKWHSAGTTFAPTTYQKGDFIIHFAGTKNQKELKAQLESYSKSVVHHRDHISLDDYFKIYGYDLLSQKNQDPPFFQIFQKASSIFSVLHVGFDTGHPTVNLLNAYPWMSVFGIDMSRRYYTDAAVEYCQRWFPERFTYCFGDANNVFQTIPREHRFDVILINRGFLYEDCLSHILNLARFAKKETLLGIGNYHLSGVGRAVLKALALGVIELIEIHEHVNSNGIVEAWFEGKYTPITVGEQMYTECEMMERSLNAKK